MLVVPPAFRRMPRWWHDEQGRAWLDELPGLVEAQCQRWSLSVDGSPRHGSNALVVPVARAGAPLALRLAPPGDDVAIEAAALRVWAGRGTVALHDVDAGRRAMLLERLEGQTTLMSLPLPEAVQVLAELVVTLAVPVSADVPGTAGIATDLAGTVETEWGELGRSVPRAHLDAVLEAAARCASEGSGGLAVDGDLHFGQVVAGERAPWLVVDPVLLRGDREYDLGRILWSRLDEVDGDSALRGLFELFVSVAGVPPDRARAWVLVRAASYLVWGLRHGLTEDPPRCRRLLEVFA